MTDQGHSPPFGAFSGTATQPRRYRSRLPGSGLIRFRRDPLTFLRELALRHGDVVRFRLGPREAYLLNNPELIRDVLVTHDRRFVKGPGLRVAERLLGQGLLTSEGEFHRRQRRLVQPAFHRPRVAAYAGTMAGYAREWQERWTDGESLDVAEEMGGLTLRIAARTLFDAEVGAEIRNVSEALTESLRLFMWATLPFAARLEPFLPFLTRRFDRARAELDAVVYRMIAERRASGEDRGDLLSMLLLACDTEGDGSGMTDLQLRDEAMTLLLAGHETTANALAWTWFLLSQNPEAEARLHAEVDTLLGGRAPTLEDVARLPYTRMVFAESMRLYPPAWIIARQAVEECPLGSFTLPAGAVVLMSQWVTHHDPRYYPEPFRFDPERWTPEAAARRPKWAYYPFGGGSRLCIGEQFAWMEGVLVLAAIAAQWRPRLVPGHPVVPQPVLTLRPKYGVRMVAERRRGNGSDGVTE
ncbi:MAG TPA: cytochrome P450 [Armatimonadota bacterium]|nr:cytochrome P450 [Armatimonadota bacterium]